MTLMERIAKERAIANRMRTISTISCTECRKIAIEAIVLRQVKELRKTN